MADDAGGPDDADQLDDTPTAADDYDKRYDRSNTFRPVVYNFRVPPNNDHKYAIPLPFTVLFDNLISVVWLTFSKTPNTMIGINQIQWALEFMKCMRVDNRYPESIGGIVGEMEKRLIELYAKVGEKLHEIRMKREEEDEERESLSNYSKIELERLRLADCDRVSYNQTDIMRKLNAIDVPIDSATGQVKSLKELNALGRREPNLEETCNLEKASSKTLLIGALQNIKTKTKDVTTKTDVEVLIKELKTRNTPATEKK